MSPEWLGIFSWILVLVDKTSLETFGQNTTPFSLNNYLLKCVKQMPDAFSTENLSIHYKLLILLKGQFDKKK